MSKESWNEYMKVLTKKEAKILKSLGKMTDRMSKENYAKKVDKETQLMHCEVVRNLFILVLC